MESTELIPLSGDIAKTTRRAEEFRDLHESLQKNLQTYLTLTMDALAGAHHIVKGSHMAEATKQMVCTAFVDAAMCIFIDHSPFYFRLYCRH